MKKKRNQQAAALLVTLWAIMMLSLLTGGFIAEMQVEARVTSYYRHRNRARYLAQAGMAYTEKLIADSRRTTEEWVEGPGFERSRAAYRLRRGLAVENFQRELDDGKFTLRIKPESSRRNIHQLDEEDWKEILDQAGVPENRWRELIDCYYDWVDEDDLQRLHGAESDDPYYRERGIIVKNAPLDSIDELLSIKHFDETLVYGGTAADGFTHRGIARLLTVWGGGRINLNSASRETLLTVPELDEWAVDNLLEGRRGLDGEEGTADDGYESVAEALAYAGLPEQFARFFTVGDGGYLRAVAVGKSGEVSCRITAVLQIDGDRAIPVSWTEEKAHE